jgi:hypothetical protein
MTRPIRVVAGTSTMPSIVRRKDRAGAAIPRGGRVANPDGYWRGAAGLCTPGTGTRYPRRGTYVNRVGGAGCEAVGGGLSQALDAEAVLFDGRPGPLRRFIRSVRDAWCSAARFSVTSAATSADSIIYSS